MIDIESMIYDAVYTAVKTAHSTVELSSLPVMSPAIFPYVTLVENDNYTYRNSQDASLTENHANIFYEVNVFTVGEDRKSVAKSILSTVDSTLQGRNFTRTVRTETPNIDRSVYRLTARYTAVVSKPETVGNNTRYTIFRK